ncbi:MULTISPECIES: hypothetical protein [Myxococcus]|uniref:hypothetical protein n=1 Tax=Myxococcus TaxID=32 RepID=UPI0013D0F6AA|nr:MULTISPECIES: hypothetical protein [Myxococcus]NVJ25201.1 hypothetical protein [Myxococcus sp. AM011]
MTRHLIALAAACALCACSDSGSKTPSAVTPDSGPLPAQGLTQPTGLERPPTPGGGLPADLKPPGR